MIHNSFASAFILYLMTFSFVILEVAGGSFPPEVQAVLDCRGAIGQIVGAAASLSDVVSAFDAPLPVGQLTSQEFSTAARDVLNAFSQLRDATEIATPTEPAPSIEAIVNRISTGLPAVQKGFEAMSDQEKQAVKSKVDVFVTIGNEVVSKCKAITPEIVNNIVKTNQLSADAKGKPNNTEQSPPAETSPANPSSDGKTNSAETPPGGKPTASPEPNEKTENAALAVNSTGKKAGLKRRVARSF